VRGAFVFCVLALGLPVALASEPLSGRAIVVDGDTLKLDGVPVRLFGIDAPERNQTCRDSRGADYRCGVRATDALASRLGDRIVRCEPRERDHYDRIVAVCFAGNTDLNGWMVAQGWALAYRRYSRDYIATEDVARAGRKGLWNGTFEKPWKVRHEDERQRPRSPSPIVATPAAPPSGCRIKGNINSEGEQIYHVPGQAYYDDTQISPAKGERWFCNETEAVAAGWRRSRS
jgi:endonuclease YncB( thermonuclease family)